MNTPVSSVVIESRIHLFSALAEAAETEHNLLCLYLFATYSLKRSTEEGLNVIHHPKAPTDHHLMGPLFR